MNAPAEHDREILDAESSVDDDLRLVRRSDLLDQLIGSAPGLSAAANLEALRGEWEGSA